jgi:putative PIN family toxin of toxin-antitoxin system
MIKIFVLDTNVIVSAYLLKNSESRKAFDLALDIGILAYSRKTILELQNVLMRPKFDRYLSLKERQKAIEIMIERGIEFETKSDFQVCRDPKDNMLLHLAVDCNAHCLVSGDIDVLTLNPFRELAILSPSDFVKRFGI